MKNRHTLDGLAVPSRHFQGFLDQFGSHVFRHGVANNSFRAEWSRRGLPGTRILPGCEYR